MPFYEGSAARRAATSAPPAPPPVPLVTTERYGTTWYWPSNDEPALPIDDSDGGCDCDPGSTPVDACVWTRQHAAIEIDDAQDVVTESGHELYNVLMQRGISKVLICGVHLNMCVLGRGFGIRQLVTLGLTVRLLRDSTDTMYSPKAPPRVDHDAATEYATANRPEPPRVLCLPGLLS